MVVANDQRIDRRYVEIRNGVLSLLALQTPVAGDVRLDVRAVVSRRPLGSTGVP